MAKKQRQQTVVYDGSDKPMPYDDRLEDSVLGSIISDEGSYGKVCDVLDESCFYGSFNKKVWEAICACSEEGKSIDLFTVANKVAAITENNDVGSIHIQVSMLAAKGEWLGLRSHAEILQELSKKRKLILLGAQLISGGSETSTEASYLLGAAQAAISDISLGGGRETFTLKSIFTDIYKGINLNFDDEYREKRMTETGFRELDKMHSFSPGNLVVIAAYPSHGKTSLATTIAVNATRKTKKVGFFSMEMTDDEIAARVLSIRTGIPSNRILYEKLNSEEVAKIDAAMGEAESLGYAENLIIDPSKGYTIEALTASINSMKQRFDVDGIVVDYLQLMDSSSRESSREEELAKAARGLKNAAGQHGIWVCLLSQLSRNGNQTQEPNVNLLRGSGQILEAADTVLLLYQPIKDNANFPEPFKNVSTKGTALVKIAKGRNSGTGAFVCGFNPEATRFYDMDELPYYNNTQQQALPQRPEAIPF